MDIFLRELRREDIGILNAWRSDPALIESLQPPFRHVGIEVDTAWFDAYLQSRGTTVRLAIVERARDAVVGVVYLTGIDWIARSADFGIMIGRPEDRGRGIGQLATRQMLEHAFLDLGLNRIGLTVFPENTAARKLYSRMGFSEEGTLRQVAFKRGAFRDMLQMSILTFDFIAAAETA